MGVCVSKESERWLLDFEEITCLVIACQEATQSTESPPFPLGRRHWAWAWAWAWDRARIWRPGAGRILLLSPRLYRERWRVQNRNLWRASIVNNDLRRNRYETIFVVAAPTTNTTIATTTAIFATFNTNQSTLLAFDQIIEKTDESLSTFLQRNEICQQRPLWWWDVRGRDSHEVGLPRIFFHDQGRRRSETNITSGLQHGYQLWCWGCPVLDRERNNAHKAQYQQSKTGLSKLRRTTRVDREKYRIRFIRL